MASSRAVSIRPPAIAGSFYPAQAPELAAEVDAFLAATQAPEPRIAWPKALILPHAGHVYSGGVAAAYYNQWRNGADTIRRVILLGPVHRVAVRGLALPGADAFATPLGLVPIDAHAQAQLRDLPQVVTSQQAHAHEHSLEVHLPFLQRLLPQFSLVPLAVGDASASEVAQVLDRLWGGPETVVLISTDLSHFHAQAAAQQIDAQTAQQILAFDQMITHEQACGATPVNGLLLSAKRRKLAIQRIAQCTSGDTAGDQRRVVGYGAFALDEADLAGDAPGKLLLSLARQAIAYRLGVAPAPRADAWWLAGEAATFVTLHLHGQLRGCIGSLLAQRPLGVDILENAVAAAFRDPRFAKVSAAELAEIQIEVSVLSQPQLLKFATEQALLEQLQPEKDGLILESSGRRSTFLPQVWEQLPDKRQFWRS